MFTHVRIENSALLINGVEVGKCPLDESLHAHAEKVAPHDWKMLSALMQIAPDHKSFEYDLYVHADLPSQKAVRSLMQASREVN